MTYLMIWQRKKTNLQFQRMMNIIRKQTVQIPKIVCEVSSFVGNPVHLGKINILVKNNIIYLLHFT